MYQSDAAHGLMFHRFHASGSVPKSQGSLNEIEFDLILQNVGIENILSPDEWLFKVKHNNLQSNDYCITFDDGLKSQYDVVLPILDKYKLKSFWFVFSSVFNGEIDNNEIHNIFITSYYDFFDDFFDDFIKFSSIPEDLFNRSNYLSFYNSMSSMFAFYSENDIKYRFVRNYFFNEFEYSSIMSDMMTAKGTSNLEISKNIWMDNNNLKNLSNKGHKIGLHSYSHPYVFSRLTKDEQKLEYSLNYEHIKSITGKDVECMSHPLNSYSIETISILNAMNIKCGFRSNMSSENDVNFIGSNNLEFPRIDSSDLKALL